MASIRLQNIGPIVDTGTIKLLPVNLFIGKQSSGKSTLLKILCYCRWLDKQAAIGTKVNGRTIGYAYGHYYRFVRELMHFYRFNNSFFTEKSKVIYSGDAIDITFAGDERTNAQITVKSRADRYNSKICFIPSERNLLSAMKNIQDGYRSSDMDMLFNFVFEWGEYKEDFTSEHKLRLTVAPDMEYYYDKEKGEQIKVLGKKKDLPPFSPFYASSGIQSAFPLEVITSSLVGMVGKNAKLSQSDLTQIIARIIRDGGSDKDLTEVLKQTRNESAQLLNYQGIQLFVEEPEQNLFPSSQMSIANSLVKAIKEANRLGENDKSMVVLTTHSPYVLSAMNVLMAASEAYEIDPAATVDIVDERFILPKGSIGAYSIDETGIVKDLVRTDIYMVDGTFLDGTSDIVEDKMAGLNEIICAAEC